MREVLRPFADSDEIRSVVVGDGSAEIHLSSGSMMATHVSGTDPAGPARPGGRGGGLGDHAHRLPHLPDRWSAQRSHLPQEIAPGAVVVRTGENLLAVIRSMQRGASAQAVIAAVSSGEMPSRRSRRATRSETASRNRTVLSPTWRSSK